MPLSPLSARHRRAAAALAILAVPVQSAAATPSPMRPSPTSTSARFQHALGLPGTGGGSLAVPASAPAPAPTRRVRTRAARVRRRVRVMQQAGRRIAHRPYVWGGGHGSFTAPGYDCSGSVSYVLHAAGLLRAPLASGGLMSYGRSGPGRHVTIYANGGHVFMVIDGRRFDTIAFKQSGTRWSSAIGTTSGYVARHPQGL